MFCGNIGYTIKKFFNKKEKVEEKKKIRKI